MKGLESFIIVFFCSYAGACQDGWTSHQGRCYLFSHDKENWASSSYICQLMGGNLAEVEGVAEDHFIASQTQSIGDNFWIGLTDLSEEGTYVWMISGATLSTDSYTNWRTNQPDNFGAEENCVLYGVSSGTSKWNDAQCSHLNKYICEKDSGSGEIVG